MTRPAVEKRPGQDLAETALLRRFAGALPLSSVDGLTRVAAWLADIEADAVGKALTTLNDEYPKLADILASIAETAPYLWDLIRADPARLLRLVTSDPDSALAALLADAQHNAAAARSHAALMRVLRRMKAEAALLIALADIGGVWPVARVTRALTDMADVALAHRGRLSAARCRPPAAGSSPATRAMPSRAPATSCSPWARWAPTS